MRENVKHGIHYIAIRKESPVIGTCICYTANCQPRHHHSHTCHFVAVTKAMGFVTAPAGCITCRFGRVGSTAHLTRDQLHDKGYLVHSNACLDRSNQRPLQRFACERSL